MSSNYTNDNNNYPSNGDNANYPDNGDANYSGGASYTDNGDTGTFPPFDSEAYPKADSIPVEPMLVEREVKPNNDKRLIIICISIVLAVAIIAAASVLTIIAIRNSNSDVQDGEATVQKEKEPADEGKEEEVIDDSTSVEGVLPLHTVLLTVPDEAENNVDMIMLFIFNQDEKKIDILSIPRDTVVDGERICEIAKSGSNINMNTLKGAVEDITGIPVNDYIHTPISCVKDSVDIFGDVYFNVPQRMQYSDPNQGLSINLSPGSQYIDGNEAEQLLRYKDYSGGDITRTQIQRDFMIEAFEQKATSDNLSLIPEWFDKVGQYIRTDMGIEDMNALATVVVDGDEAYTIDEHLIPYSSIGDDSFICDYYEMRDMAEELGF